MVYIYWIIHSACHYLPGDEYSKLYLMGIQAQKSSNALKIKHLGRREYTGVWQAMKRFTETREHDAADQLWILEHEPVYTIGLNGDKKHLVQNVSLPVVRVDRGGQITYHGPGQLVIYLLLDLKRRHCGIKNLVSLLENALITLLAGYGINAHTIDAAPGVYVNQMKIASLGIRIKKNGCYHGLSLNVDMDLSPFDSINPCGYQDMRVTQLVDLGCPVDILTVSHDLCKILTQALTSNQTAIQAE